MENTCKFGTSAGSIFLSVGRNFFMYQLTFNLTLVNYILVGTDPMKLLKSELVQYMDIKLIQIIGISMTESQVKKGSFFIVFYGLHLVHFFK